MIPSEQETLLEQEILFLAELGIRSKVPAKPSVLVMQSHSLLVTGQR